MGLMSPGITSVWYRTVAGGDNLLTVRIKSVGGKRIKINKLTLDFIKPAKSIEALR